MNERIQALANKAGYNDQIYEISKEGLEKFAELIVAECISVVDDAERSGSNEIWDNAVKFIRRDIQEHFGVE
jgi:hypothetical protein